MSTAITPNEAPKEQVAEIIPANRVLMAALLCFFIAFCGSLALCVTGLVSPQIAKGFGVDTAHIVKLDVMNVIGVLIGCAISGKILSKLGCRLTLFILGIGLFLSQLIIGIQSSLTLYAILIFFSGLFWGCSTTSLTFLIVAAYSVLKKSDAKLTFMNFFFGAGGMIGSSLFGIIVYHTSWRVGFILSGCICLLIAVAAAFIRLNEIIGANTQKEEVKTEIKDTEPNKSITFGVILVAIAFIAYVYIEYIVNYWWSPYLQLDLGHNVATVGIVMSVWGASIAAGRFIFGLFSFKKLGSHRFIYLGAISIIFTFLLFLAFHSNLALIFIWTAVLGLSCSALAPTIFSYGLKNTKNLSKITTSFLATAGTFGGILSMLTSSSISQIVQNRETAIFMGPIVALIMVLFVVLAEKYRKKHFGNVDNNA